MKPDDRFDKLLKAMAEGEAPKHSKAAKGEAGKHLPVVKRQPSGD